MNVGDMIVPSSDRSTWCGPEEVPGVLDLSRNTCYDRHLKNMISEWFKEMPGDSLFTYPDERKLQQHICDRHQVDIDNIAIGLGSGEVLNRVIWLLRNRTLHVVSPTFQMVDILAKQYGCKMKHLNYTEFNKFNIDKIPKNSIVYIANPNGNNGHSFSIEQIIHIHKNCELLILDEAYVDFGGQAYSILSDSLIVLRTFSKSICLPGARCGYAVSTKNNIKALQHCRPSIVTTTTACELIPKLIPEIENHVSRMKQCKQYLCSKFNHVNSDGNYVLVDTKHVENIQSFKYKEVDMYARFALTDKHTMTRLVDEY